jgi:hypothetical protein
MGVNTPKSNRLNEIAADQSLIDGLAKHASAIPSLGINGAFVATKDITTTLQSRVDSAKNAQSVRATWLAAVKADTDLRDKTKTFVSGLRAALLTLFAGQIDTLADFALTPRKTRVVTPEAKVAAASKAKATRAARHTMGKKQKAAIHGTVPVTDPGPATPAPAPTVPSTPPSTTPPGGAAPTPVHPEPVPAPPPPAASPTSPPASPVTAAPVTPVPHTVA